MKKIVRLSEKEMTNLIKKIIKEDAFEPSPLSRREDRSLNKITDRLEDAYMRRDWIIIREVISDLKHKIKRGSF
jgi:hypothetical protein